MCNRYSHTYYRWVVTLVCDDVSADSGGSVYSAYVLTLSPGSPLEEANGSYCPGLCLNRYTKKELAINSIILKKIIHFNK